MSVVDSIQTIMDRWLGPIATKLSGNRGIQAISGGMMATMPVSLGIALIAIVVNLPIPGFEDFLMSSGAYAYGMALMSVTMSMLGIYITVGIGYRFGTMLGLNGLTSAIFCMGVFLGLIPLTSAEVDGATSSLLDPTYMGSNGIFMAIIIGLAVPAILSFLMKHVAFKLPDTVPPMVSDSLSPTFAAIIIFTGTFLIKWGFSFTPWGNVFDMVTTLVGMPITNIGTQLWAPIVVQILAMTFWFFGIHPSAVVNIYNIVATACTAANLEAFVAGNPLPYLEWQVLYNILSTGFAAEGLPLAIALLTSKSARYKATSRLALIPAIFNITEPMMFGIPVVLNPVFAIPMILIKALVGGVTILLLQLGLVQTLNVAVSMTWIMPYPVTAFLMGGVGFLIIALVGFVVSFLFFFPFVRMADNMALKQEREAAEAETAGAGA